jgi:hypothetical protein
MPVHELVKWPAALRFDGESDVSIVQSDEEWTHDTDLSGYRQEGSLLDSAGNLFVLVFEPASGVSRFLDRRDYLRPVSAGKQLSIEDALEYLRPQARAYGPSILQQLQDLASTSRHVGFFSSAFELLRAAESERR